MRVNRIDQINKKCDAHPEPENAVKVADGADDSLPHVQKRVL